MILGLSNNQGACHIPLYMGSTQTIRPRPIHRIGSAVTSLSEPNLVKTSTFNIFYANVQGIENKIEEVELILKQTNYNIACICEHWLKPEEVMLCVPDGFVVGNNFCRTEHIRGGVSILVSEQIIFKPIDLSKYCLELHFEVTGILIPGMDCVVVALYRSPNGNTEIFLNALEECLMSLSSIKCSKLIIFGDVNEAFNVTKNKSTVVRFSNLLRQFNLYCVNSEPTRGKACLDNIMTNLTPAEYNFNVSHHHVLADHNALHFEVISKNIKTSNLDKPMIINDNLKIRKITKSNCDSFKYLLANEDWSDILFPHSSASECFEKFFKKFYQLFNTCFPPLMVKNKLHPRIDKPKISWYTPELQSMKNNILLCKEIYNVTCDSKFYVLLCKLRGHYRRALRNAKKMKNEEYIEKSVNKCKAAWSIISKIKGKSVQNNGVSSIQPDDFNNFFLSSVEEIMSKVNISINSAVNFVEKMRPSASDMKLKCFFSEVTTQDVYNVIMSLKSSETRDVYGLTSVLLKYVVDFIQEPLTFCINYCIAEGVFPPCLKLSRVVPVFKKGNVKEPCNYRPISCIPVLAKVLEKVIKIQVCEYFEKFNLFSSSQYGYRNGRCAIQAVDNLVTQLLDALEAKEEAQVTLCDLSKAFDCVQHHILLKKLEYYGLHDKELAMFNSYLTDRKQIVDVRGNLSKEVVINHGVPQGSILGPILFVIMINDFSSNLSCPTTIYADDTSLMNNHRDIFKLEEIADKALTDSISWFESNGLYLNNDKTQKLIVSLKPTNLVQESSHVQLLGITIDSKLSWHEHINKVCKKLSRVVYLLVNLKRQVTPKYLRMAYFAFFESVLRYGIIIWGNSTSLQKVLLLQKKVVRILTNSRALEHCKPLFIVYNILTVVNLYILNVLIFVKNNLHLYNERNEIHCYNTRSCRKLDLLSCRLSKTKNYHIAVGIRLFNRLPRSIQNLTVNKYCKRIRDWLVKNPFYSVDEYFKCNVDSM